MATLTARQRISFSQTTSLSEGTFAMKRMVMLFALSHHYKLFSFLFLSAAISCAKKSPTPLQPSSEKKIIYFAIEGYKNPGLYTDAVGLISNDTIRFVLIDNYPLGYIFPTIGFSGKHIAPAETIAQNFSNPVIYTVTANDGTTKKYIVLAKSIFSHISKEIVFFSFRSIDNPSLTNDINASIHNDSILVRLPFGTNLHGLVPFILINGVSVVPNNLAPQDFSQLVIYKVTADDGSAKNYLVIVSS